jgi:uncharacterized RDD family membrane protein YckC
MTTPPEEPFDDRPRPPWGMPSYDEDAGFDGVESLPAPPGVWVGPPLASWIQRVAAAFVDLAITVGPWIALGELGAPGQGFLLFLVLSAGVQLLQGRTGQSPGKRLLRLRLLREADGRPLGFAGAYGRSWLHLVDAMACFVGFFWPIWDGRRQTFADKIIESVVIRAAR